MTFAWTPEFIQDSLIGLSPTQLAALDLLSSTPTTVRPGAARLKKYGFDTAADYETALAAARAQVLAFFAVRGIHHVDDLDFPESGRSAEGRIQKSASKGIRKAAA